MASRWREDGQRQSWPRTPPPEAGSLQSPALFGDTPEEAERLAMVYLGENVSQN